MKKEQKPTKPVPPTKEQVKSIVLRKLEDIKTTWPVTDPLRLVRE